MAKAKKLQRKHCSRCHVVNRHKISSRWMMVSGDAHHKKKHLKASRKKELKDAICSVCMEFPHNAILLLCSSYDKGCRAYMCATSDRYSNCLEQYRKAYTKVISNNTAESSRLFSEESALQEGMRETSELLCPLCRGQVKGWTVVESARKYLNMMKRSCMQDKCPFVGTYKELRKHVKLEHPLSRPWHVDPSHAEKWRNLENERELSDVFSTIRSTMPGGVIIGDYVIERSHRNVSTDYGQDDYLFGGHFRFPVYGRHSNVPQFSPNTYNLDDDSVNEVDFATNLPRDSVAPRSIVNNGSRIGHPGRFLARRRGERPRIGR